MDARPPRLRERLSLLMFLTFFIWGGWWVPAATYVKAQLGFTEGEMGLIMATIPFGAIISPLFVGYIADRLFATQFVLAALHVIGGICLIVAGMLGSFGGMFWVLMLNTLCFMPTLALSNSLAFRNLDDPNKFPRIALFGTIGWIVAGLPSLFFLMAGTELPWERVPYFFYMTGVVELALAAYCVTLPHTPPKARSETGGDVLGLGALKLLKQPSFLLFAACAFLVVIPIQFYFTGFNLMLSEGDRPAPTTLQTLGQVTEIFAMAAMPVFISALGLKNVIALGMFVWVLRYLLFATNVFPLMLLGIIIHGFGYVFVFVGSYIYVDKKAPRDLRASAQSLIAFLMLGVGMSLGSLISGTTLGEFPGAIRQMAAQKDGRDVNNAPIPTWTELVDTLGTSPNGQITRNEIGKKPDGVTIQGCVFSQQELSDKLLAADNLKELHTRGDFRSIMPPLNEITVTKADWIRAKLHHWAPYWLWPALAVAVIGIVYAIGMGVLPELPDAVAPASPPTQKPAAEVPPAPMAPPPVPVEAAPPPPSETPPGMPPPPSGAT